MTTKMATETYRFDGMKNDWDKTSRIVLKGSTDNPEEWVDLKGNADLSEEQANDLKAHGVKLTKLSPEEADKAKQKQLESVTAAASKRGADQMDPQAVLRARRLEEEQAKASEGDQPPAPPTGSTPPQPSGTDGSSQGSGDSSGDTTKQSGKSSGGKS